MTRSSLYSLVGAALLEVSARLGVLGRAMDLYVFRKLLGDGGRVDAWRRLGCRIDGEVRIGPRVSMRFPDRVTIGDGTSIGGRAWLDAWGPISIGRRCLLNGDITLLSAGHHINSHDFDGDIRSISIGDYVWLPHQIIVMPGVKIGRAAVVGTGSVVTRDVPERAIVAGNPARVIGERADVAFTYVPSRM